MTQKCHNFACRSLLSSSQKTDIMNKDISARFWNKDNFKIFFLSVKQKGSLENTSSIVCLMKILCWHIKLVYILLPTLSGLQDKAWKICPVKAEKAFCITTHWNEWNEGVATDLVKCPHLWDKLCSAYPYSLCSELSFLPEQPVDHGFLQHPQMGVTWKSTEYDRMELSDSY